jgi:5-methyltetrahydropteroyltriglutamate--homocysteine methyltransferase
MLTVTRDLLMPTTVTGSWPRPLWYAANLERRALSAGMTDLNFREQFLDATRCVIADQEYAGLDILTNGDYHLDSDFAGRSWHGYPLQRFAGMSREELESTSTRYVAPNGTWWSEIVSGWRFPGVVGPVGPGLPLEFAKIWRIAQAATDRPVKFGTNSADALASVLNIHTPHYDDDKRQLMWDIATVMNAELRQVVAAGCRVIQLEDPMFHVLQEDDPELVDFLVELFNHQVSGLEEAEIWVHTCFGNPGAQGIARSARSYAASVETYLTRLNIDVWQIESKDNGHDSLDVLRPYRGRLPRKVGVGMISHRTLQVEAVDEVASDIRRVLEVVDVEHLVLTSDCGFGRQGASRPIALYKAAAMAQGANVVRRELGLPERDIPATDERHQIDPSLLAADARHAPIA